MEPHHQLRVVVLWPAPAVRSAFQRNIIPATSGQASRKVGYVILRHGVESLGPSTGQRLDHPRHRPCQVNSIDVQKPFQVISNFNFSNYALITYNKQNLRKSLLMTSQIDHLASQNGLVLLAMSWYAVQLCFSST